MRMRLSWSALILILASGFIVSIAGFSSYGTRAREAILLTSASPSLPKERPPSPAAASPPASKVDGLDRVEL